MSGFFFSGSASTVLLAAALCLSAPAARAQTTTPPPAATQRAATTQPAALSLNVAFTAQVDGMPAAPPAFDAGHAFIAVKDGEEKKGRLVAISLADGTVRWTFDLSEIQSVTAGNGLVFASTTSELRAFAASSGEPAWQVPIDSRLSAPPGQANGWLIVATENARLTALRAENGGTIWDATLPSRAVVTPVVSGDALYVGLADGRAMRLNLQAGKTVWETKLAATPSCMLALDDRVFAGTAGRWFYAINTKDGHVAWRVRTGSDVVGSPVVDERNVYFISLDNLVRSLNRRDGSLRGQHVLSHRARFGPVACGDLLFVTGPSATIEALARGALLPAGSFDVPEDPKLIAPVHAIEGLLARDFLLFAMTAEGELIALRPDSMTPR